jgi:NDP-4-keto-2,6-dideoxyhexose 3-C-methyltransferase
VVDIGANDGVTLRAYRSRGITRVGFEPSNIRPDGVHDLIYIPEAFSAKEFRRQFPDRTVRVITSIAMFYDIDDPAQCCAEIHELLSEDGVWVIEMSYLGAMLDNNSFDAVCHEHLGYYSLATLEHLAGRAGFAFHDITFNAANGGSIRCYLRKASSTVPVPAASRRRIEQALEDERARGYLGEKVFERFRRSVEEIRAALRETLERLRGEGKRVYGYGASTKGNVLLQAAGIGAEHLVAIADRNPAKVGRRTLGTGIPICSEAQMREARPDYLLILPWHFLDEFLEREHALRASGTKFIVPFPGVHII